MKRSYLLGTLATTLLIGMIASTAFSFRDDEPTNRLAPPARRAKPTERQTANRKATQPVALGRVELATANTFDKQVMKSSGPVLVDFYADWCGPCQIQGRVLKGFAPRLRGAKIVKVNVDENASLARRFGITALPTLLLVREGKVVGKQVGLATETQLKSVFANYLVEPDGRASVDQR